MEENGRLDCLFLILSEIDAFLSEMRLSCIWCNSNDRRDSIRAQPLSPVSERIRL
jgi:hypothetical protein